MTHDYKRHGTTTLFATLDVLERRVIGQCMARHRHQEFHPLSQQDQLRDPGRAGTPPDRRQLRHAQASQGARLAGTASEVPLSLHPDLGLMLNAVEGFFAKLTRQRLKRGALKGIVVLHAAINRFLAETNNNPKPFTWTANPDAIIDKARRGKQALESIH